MFLPLTLVTVGGRALLPGECAGGAPSKRGLLFEFDRAYMLCHEACLIRLEEADAGD